MCLRAVPPLTASCSLLRCSVAAGRAAASRRRLRNRPTRERELLPKFVIKGSFGIRPLDVSAGSSAGLSDFARRIRKKPVFLANQHSKNTAMILIRKLHPQAQAAPQVIPGAGASKIVSRRESTSVRTMHDSREVVS